MLRIEKDQKVSLIFEMGYLIGMYYSLDYSETKEIRAFRFTPAKETTLVGSEDAAISWIQEISEEG